MRIGQGRHELTIARKRKIAWIISIPFICFIFMISCKNQLSNDTLETGDNNYIFVTHISGIPAEATIGMPLELNAIISPSNAVNKTIVWSLKNAGGTGAVLTGNILTINTAD